MSLNSISGQNQPRSGNGSQRHVSRAASEPTFKRKSKRTEGRRKDQSQGLSSDRRSSVPEKLPSLKEISKLLSGTASFLKDAAAKPPPQLPRIYLHGNAEGQSAKVVTKEDLLEQSINMSRSLQVLSGHHYWQNDRPFWRAGDDDRPVSSTGLDPETWLKQRLNVWDSPAPGVATGAASSSAGAASSAATAAGATKHHPPPPPAKHTKKKKSEVGRRSAGEEEPREPSLPGEQMKTEASTSEPASESVGKGRADGEEPSEKRVSFSMDEEASSLTTSEALHHLQHPDSHLGLKEDTQKFDEHEEDTTQTLGENKEKSRADTYDSTSDVDAQKEKPGTDTWEPTSSELDDATQKLDENSEKPRADTWDSTADCDAANAEG